MQISFFPLLLWITAENRTKLNKLFNYLSELQNQAEHNIKNKQTSPDYPSATAIILLIFWTERDFCRNSFNNKLKNLWTTKNFHKPANTHSSSEEFLNDTHKEKLCFIQFSTRMAGWLLLTFFIMFIQSIKFYTFHYHALRVQMFEKCGSWNRQLKWKVAPSSMFYSKIWVGFCLYTGKRYFLEVSF